MVFMENDEYVKKMNDKVFNSCCCYKKQKKNPLNEIMKDMT